MFKAKLLVDHGNHRGSSQDWGHFAFLSAPSPGDRVAIARDGAQHYLTVLSVHHRPVAIAGESDPVEPAAEVVARWTGSDVTAPP